jgi:hypothetical protein
MAKEKRGWIVAEHSPLQQLDDNLWAIDGNVPKVPVKRRMCIVRMLDGSLLFVHAIPVDDATLEQIKSLGRPAYLIVGHDQHCIDADAFQKKLGLKVYGPKACEAKLRERVDLAGTLEAFPADASVTVESVPGTKQGESMVTVRSGDRTSLLFSDVIQNNPKEKMPVLFRIMGFAGGPKVVWVFRKMFIENRSDLKAALAKWAALPGLARLIPVHGAIVDRDPSTALAGAAAGL